MSFFDVPIGSTIPWFFDTRAIATGASVTMTGLTVATVKIFKGTATAAKTSTACTSLIGAGMNIVGTGIHGFAVNTGDVSDLGYFAVGSYYNVIVDAVTIDAQTVRLAAFKFRLTPAETQVGHRKVDAQFVAGAAPETGTVMADILLDRADGVEVNLTPRNALRLAASAAGGKTSGMGTTTGIIRNAVADTKNRVTATMDVDGNRSAITYDFT